MRMPTGSPDVTGTTKTCERIQTVKKLEDSHYLANTYLCSCKTRVYIEMGL